MSMDVAEKFVSRIQKSNDNLSSIITVHLFCENAINKLIEKEARRVNKTGSNDSYIPIENSAYGIKLYFAYSIDLIGEKLYENLRLLNFWRNRVAHDVHTEIKDLPMDFHVFDENAKKLSSDMEEKDLIIALAVATYVELHLYITKEYNISL